MAAWDQGRSFLSQDFPILIKEKDGVPLGALIEKTKQVSSLLKSPLMEYCLIKTGWDVVSVGKVSKRHEAWVGRPAPTESAALHFSRSYARLGRLKS